MAAATVSVYARLPVYGPGAALLSVAVTVKLKLPPAVGVPESVPSAASASPAGSAPAVMANV